MAGFVGVSQQADEGYSEDPLNQPEPASFVHPYKPNTADDAPSNNPLSTASPTRLKSWLSSHVASLPTDLRARTWEHQPLPPPLPSPPALFLYIVHLARMLPYDRPVCYGRLFLLHKGVV